MTNKILTTIEEVAELPVGTIVVDSQENAGQVYRSTPGAQWQAFGDTEYYNNARLSLPVTVLYAPEESAPEEPTCVHCGTTIYKSLDSWYHKSNDSLFCDEPLQATPAKETP